MNNQAVATTQPPNGSPTQSSSKQTPTGQSKDMYIISSAQNGSQKGQRDLSQQQKRGSDRKLEPARSSRRGPINDNSTPADANNSYTAANGANVSGSKSVPQTMRAAQNPMSQGQAPAAPGGQSPYSAPVNGQAQPRRDTSSYEKKKPAADDGNYPDDGSTGGCSGEDASQGMYRRNKKAPASNGRGGSTYRGGGPPSMQQQRMVYQAYKRQAVSTGRQGVTSQSPNAPGARPGNNLQIQAENQQYNQVQNQYSYNGQYTPQTTTTAELQQRQNAAYRGQQQPQTSKATMQLQQMSPQHPVKKVPAPAAPPQQKQGQVATQATKELLKKTLEFTPSQLQELQRAGRFGKEPVPQEYAIIPPQRPEMRGRKTLVLDLDETLIHSKFSLAQVQASRFQGRPDFQMRIVVDGRPIQVYVLIRPGVLFFLQRLAAVYELVLYTASMNIYANPLVDTLDQDTLIHMRLYREHCFSFQGSYIKDLSLLGRPMKDVIIVDNSPNAYFFHPENAVPILSWYDDLDDRCLFELIPLLEALSQVNDVRTVIPHFVEPTTALVDFPKAAFLLNETIRKQIASKTSGSQQKQRGPPTRDGKADEQDAIRVTEKSQLPEGEGHEGTESTQAEFNRKARNAEQEELEEDGTKKLSPPKNAQRVKRSGKQRDESAGRRGEEKDAALNVDDEISDDNEDADKEAAPMNNNMNATSSQINRRSARQPQQINKQGSQEKREDSVAKNQSRQPQPFSPAKPLTQQRSASNSQRPQNGSNNAGSGKRILKSSEIETNDLQNDINREKLQITQRRGNTSGNHKPGNLEIFTPAESLAMQPPATTHLQRMMQVRSTSNKSKNESQLGQQPQTTTAAGHGAPLSPKTRDQNMPTAQQYAALAAQQHQNQSNSRRRQQTQGGISDATAAIINNPQANSSKMTPTGNYQPRNNNLFNDQPATAGNPVDHREGNSGPNTSAGGGVGNQRRRTGGTMGTTVIMMGPGGEDGAGQEPPPQRKSKQGFKNNYENQSNSTPHQQPGFSKNTTQIKMTSNPNDNTRRISRAQQLLSNQQQNQMSMGQNSATNQAQAQGKPLNFNLRRGVERYHGQPAPTGVVSSIQATNNGNDNQGSGEMPPMVRGATGSGQQAGGKLIGKNSLHMKRRSEHPDSSALAQTQASHQRYTADGQQYNGGRNGISPGHAGLKHQQNHLFNQSGLSVGGVTPSNSVPNHGQASHLQMTGNFSQQEGGQHHQYQLPQKTAGGSSTTPVFQKRIQTFSASHLDKQNHTQYSAAAKSQQPVFQHQGPLSSSTGPHHKQPHTAQATNQKSVQGNQTQQANSLGGSVGLLQNVVMQPQPPKTSRVIKVMSPQSARGGPAQLNLGNGSASGATSSTMPVTGAQSQSTRHRNPPMLISTPLASGGVAQNGGTLAQNKMQQQMQNNQPNPAQPRQNQWMNVLHKQSMNQNGNQGGANATNENRSQKNFNATAPSVAHNHQIVFQRQDSHSRGKLKISQPQANQNIQSHNRVLSVPRERPPPGSGPLQGGGGAQFRVPPTEGTSKTPKHQIPQQSHSRSQSHSHHGTNQAQNTPGMFSHRAPGRN